MVNELKEIALRLQTVAAEYDELSEEEQKKARHLIYQQTGQFGHILFKPGKVPAGKSVMNVVSEIMAKLEEKE